MELTVYKPNNIAIGVIDEFSSLIWTERYNECGDFELCCSVNAKMLPLMSIGNYLKMTGSYQTMIIETIKITTDVENGNQFYITGRSLESLLDRRIVWDKKYYPAGRQVKLVIRDLIRKDISETENAHGVPYNRMAERRIHGFHFNNEMSSSVPESLQITEALQFHGENLYETIKAICEAYGVGFRISYNPNDDVEQYVFNVYYGKDLSYHQNENPAVVFSTGFDNLLGSDYYKSVQEYKNVAHVGGEEKEDIARIYADVKPDGSFDHFPSDLDRREIFVDAGSISKDRVIIDETTGDAINISDYSNSKSYAVGDYCKHEDYIYRCTHTIGNSGEEWDASHWNSIATAKLSDEEYRARLRQEGISNLADNVAYETFEGQMTDTSQFVYGRDFSLGDIVQIQNEYGMEAMARIKEIIHSHDESGENLYPTFSLV